MRPSAHSKACWLVASAALMALPLVSQTALKREPGGWTRTYTAALPAGSHLRVTGHGPVSVVTGGRSFSYTIKVTVSARTEAEARRILDRMPPQVEARGD